MLPGMDFGDTPSFQARIGTALLTPRDGYPLYTAIGSLFYWLAGGDAGARVEPRFGCGRRLPRAACSSLVGVELSGSVIAATAAALLFAVRTRSGASRSSRRSTRCTSSSSR